MSNRVNFSTLIVFLCLGFVGEVERLRVAKGGRERSPPKDESNFIVDARVGEPLLGVKEGPIIGLGCSVGLPSETTRSSLLSNLLTKLELELPQVFASIPLGIPYLPVTLPRIPLSPDTATAALLSDVGVGILASVEGARLLGGMSRMANLKVDFGIAGGTIVFMIGKLGPTGIEP